MNRLGYRKLRDSVEILVLCAGCWGWLSVNADDSGSHRQPGNVLAQVAQLSESARKASELREYAEAQADLQQALALLAQPHPASWRRLHATVYCQLGVIAIEQGDWVEGEKTLVECLQQARSLGEQQLIGEALVRLGQNDFKRGQLKAANTHLREAITVTTAIQDQANLAFAHLWLGAIGALQGNSTQAESELLEAVTIAGAAGNRSIEARARNILGENARLHAQYDVARAHYQEALALYQSINNRFGMTMVVHNLGHLATMEGKTDVALAHYDDALRMAIEIDAIPAALEILAALAGLAAHAGDVDRALELLGLVFSHPAAPKEALHLFAEPTLAGLRNEIARAVIESGLARGQALNFEEVVQDLLNNNPLRGSKTGAEGSLN